MPDVPGAEPPGNPLDKVLRRMAEPTEDMSMSTPQAQTWKQQETARIEARIAALKASAPGYIGNPRQMDEVLDAIATLRAELADVEAETRFA